MLKGKSGEASRDMRSRNGNFANILEHPASDGNGCMNYMERRAEKVN